jgi:capsular polysaccharide biosynthesis protein
MQLFEYTQVLRAWWWIILLTVGTAILLAALYGAVQAPVYRSSVRLEVTSRPDYGQLMAVEKLLRPLAARAVTTAVASAVDERLGAGTILGKARAQVIPDAMHIQVDVEDGDPLRAERIARAFGDVIQERQTAAMSTVPEYQRVLVSPLDQPSAARQVWPPTRSLIAAGALLGLLSGTVLAFVADFTRGLKIRGTASA